MSLCRAAPAPAAALVTAAYGPALVDESVVAVDAPTRDGLTAVAG
jgi:hypothetical protein